MRSDEELAAAVARGDIAAFSVLYDRYAQRIYAWGAHVVGAAEAADIVQEVFLRLWEKAAQFDPGRGRFATWFMAVARHHLISVAKKRSQQERLVAAAEIERLLANTVDERANTEREALGNIRGDAVVRALADIPAEQRRVLILAYFAGLTQSQIAAQLREPLGTVKKRTRLGLQKLRLALAEESVRAGFG